MGLPEWTPSIIFCLFNALPMVTAFNIDESAWKQMSMPTSSFGYRVIQEDTSSVLVSAPLEQYGNMRGRVYKCQLPAGSCSPVNINVPSSAVNMSLGLTMSRSEIGRKTLVCGPTIPIECDRITQYGGMCFGLTSRGSQEGPCQATDIAFLLDGSGSVAPTDFMAMKTFVVNLIKKLLKQNTRFAISQYSSDCQIHVNFNQFRSTGRWEYQVNSIQQLTGGTNTAGAINKLLNSLFVASGGARPNANKILIVITDGESQDGYYLPSVIARADAKNIIRYAIGVGGAFRRSSAREELNKIATSPAEHVFKVDSFAALDRISGTLEKNIIAIEGTQTSGEATKMEFAQSGFSAVYSSSPASNYFLGTVGAYGWTGGFQQFSAGFQNPKMVKVDSMSPDSYLGYSLDVAYRDSRNYIILGAPRYEHKGLVMVINSDINVKYSLTQTRGQIGSYFGAEVCAVDIDGDGISDLILVSAPMNTDDDFEGKVFVYKFKSEYFYSVVQDTGVSLLGMAGQRGRFGSSLASLADLNGDGIRDVAVGAPLEDNGQGSVYIFNGRRGGINPTYSQRIAGSSVHSKLQFFGLTVAPSALDQSGDKLPDIAVGSKGKVLLLRSRPIVSIVTTVTFDPAKIPTSISDCTQPEMIVAKICFVMRKETPDFLDLRATLKYNLTVDATRDHFRASFGAKKRSQAGVVDLHQRNTCTEQTFSVECSPEDILNPLFNSLSFVFEGLPISRTENLTPVLSPSSDTSAIHSLDFEIDCGNDKVCVDNLKIDFNFSGSTDIEVGITQELNVTVMLENTGENSYNTHVYFTYPPGLSYRTFKKNKGRVECTSRDSEDRVTPGLTTCDVSRPVFKAGDKAVFVIQYGIDSSGRLGQRVNFTAKADSGNGVHAPDSITSITKDIGVKYSIYIVIKRSDDSTNYINFTAGENNLAKPVQQNLQVVNAWRDLTVTVFVKVPIKLQEENIWTDLDSLKMINGCRTYKDMKPVGDVIKKLQKDLTLDCSVAECRVFTCDIDLTENSQRFLNISGNVSSTWIEKTGLREAQLALITEATMEYDQNKYIYFSDSRKQPPVSKIKTIVEVYDVPNFTKEIIGGTVGGLILLALITAGLVKAGFFKSQYKQMMEEAAGQDTEGAPAE
ncbi:integrin alpha-M-like [Alosa alosa]|uniref:integrin alpha-M-like n=1 Tax=Alosa alosa TaxID=278164 RepID=UPI0020154F89|nr:integrin alpha-M-like [Alosa alosa]